jgi:ferredoxin
MLVDISRARCRGYANCVVAAPGYFELDDSGMAVSVGSEPEGDDAEVLETLRRAASLCPVSAITVTAG